jgi:hypothetical protein
MKFLLPYCEIINQRPGLKGAFEITEKAGRICYHSWKNIKDGSAEKFVERMVSSGHFGMVEHSTIYLTISGNNSKYSKNDFDIEKYSRNPYSKVIKEEFNNGDYTAYVTTNYHVIIENNWLDDIKNYISENNIPTKHERRITFLVHVDRITGESFLRHRTVQSDELPLEDVPIHIDDFSFSYARESTRFVNFSKGEFSKDIKFIIPRIVTDNSEVLLTNSSEDDATQEWINSCSNAEKHYMNLIEKGWPPQYARYSLGFSIYSPLIMTAFSSDWNKFFALRCSDSKIGKPHPDASFIADMAREQIKNLK